MSYLLIVALVGIGLFAAIRCDNIIRKIMALSIVNSGIIMLFVYEGARIGTEAPILLPGIEDVVDPLPQALMLTAIVIGISITALALVLVMRMYRAFGTVSMQEIERKLVERDE